MRGADGRLLVDGREVRGRWTEYFKELLNVADEREAVIVAVGDARRVTVMSEEDNRSITTEEVQMALARVKTGNAAGGDGCLGECLTKDGKEFVEWLVRLFNVCFREGTVLLE